jgi:uncharacterized protein
LSPAPGLPALHAAAERGDVSAVSALLDAGADIDARDQAGRTALLAATHGSAVQAARLLVARGANLEIADDLKDTPLLYAGAEGRIEILRLLVKAGANLRARNRYGGNALIPAAHHGHVEAVRELLTKTSIDVNHVNDPGWTALIEAVILADGGPTHQRIVRLLLDHGADPALADRDGVTPLEHARRRGYQEMVTMLEAAAR